jgi:hypothetical protein
LLLALSFFAALSILSRRMALLARLVTVLMLLSSLLVSLLAGVALVLLARSGLFDVSCLLLAILGLLAGPAFLLFIAHIQISVFSRENLCDESKTAAAPGLLTRDEQPRFMRAAPS